MSDGTAKPVVGFIGVGLMGHGIAANMLKAGYPLWIKGNRNRDPVEDLLQKGAREAASPREIAERSEIVQLCLPNSAAVEAAVLGDNGIAASGKAGLIVIDSTTADPMSTERLAALLAGAGMTMVDAPLGRTPKEAEEGTLDAMVGADDATYARIRPLIECWAGAISRTGPVGSAHKMKLIMNFIGMGYAAIYAEALSLGVKSGIAPQTIRDVIGASRLSNGFFDTFMRYGVGRDPEAHKFTLENAGKDVRYVASMALATGTLNPMGAAIRNYFAHTVSSGNGQDYVGALSDHVARLNGIDLAKAVADAEKP
ncbi:MAG: NAD(P)-dependent oxidoreductase [Rhodobacteraceae bacterium]|nr:NAD(P)-dependent oxidoreductase [Paracoccaceae bacterium]